eukprot:429261_1
MLLVDQYLYISNTINFSDNNVKVDALLYTLKVYKSKIIDKNTFLRQIGLKLNGELISLIKQHPSLLQITASVSGIGLKQTILDRLVDELDVVDLAPFRSASNVFHKLQVMTVLEEKTFWNKMGFDLNNNIISEIKQHPLLLESTNMGMKQTFLDRLIAELHIAELLRWYRVKYSTFEFAENNSLLNVNVFKIQMNTKYDYVDIKDDNVCFEETIYTLINVDGEENAVKFKYNDGIALEYGRTYEIKMLNPILFSNTQLLLQTIGVPTQVKSWSLVDALFVVDNSIKIETNGIPVDIQDELCKYRFVITPVRLRQNIDQSLGREDFTFNNWKEFNIPFVDDTGYAFMNELSVEPLDKTFKIKTIKKFAVRNARPWENMELSDICHIASETQLRNAKIAPPPISNNKKKKRPKNVKKKKRRKKTNDENNNIKLVAVITDRLDCVLNKSGDIIIHELLGSLSLNCDHVSDELEKYFYGKVTNLQNTNQKIFNQETTTVLDNKGNIRVKLGKYLGVGAKNRIDVLKYIWNVKNIQSCLPFCINLLETEQKENIYIVSCQIRPNKNYNKNVNSIKNLSITGVMEQNMVECIEYTELSKISFIWFKEEPQKFKWIFKNIYRKIDKQYTLMSKFRSDKYGNNAQLKIEFEIENVGISTVNVTSDVNNKNNNGEIIQTVRYIRTGKFVLQ